MESGWSEPPSGRAQPAPSLTFLDGSKEKKSGGRQGGELRKWGREREKTEEISVLSDNRKSNDERRSRSMAASKNKWPSPKKTRKKKDENGTVLCSIHF